MIMMFLKSYSISEQNYGMWGGQWGGQGSTNVNVEISFDTETQARQFCEDLNYSMDNIRRFVKKKTNPVFKLTCPKCFKTTYIITDVCVTSIGSGNDIIGVCCDCDNVFLGTVHQ